MEFESTSAVNTVFAVTELLENILLGLPCRTLLLAQRTCKAWRDTIKHSDNIQKALCFKTVGPFDNAHHSKGIAPMLFINFDRPMLVDVTSAREYLDCIVLNRYHVKPLLKVFFEEAEPEPEQYSYCTPQYQCKTGAPMLSLSNSSINMFITQPPTTTIQFECCQDVKYWDGPRTLHNPDGVTVNDVMAKIAERRCASSKLSYEGTTYILDFIVPIEQDPVQYQKAMQQIFAEYYRMREEGED